MALVVSVFRAAEVALPQDERLAYIGRFTNEGPVRRFGWSASQIVAQFKGRSISANLSASVTADRYLPVIDGKPGTPLTTSKGHGWKTYTLGQGLSDSEHSLALWKISEDSKFWRKWRSGLAGAAAFGGLSADSFLAPLAPQTRRLEFIGDSDTAGFCADQKPGWLVDSDVTKYQNAYETYAARISRAFNADMVVQAISGYGVTSSSGQIQPHIGNVLPFSDEFKWNFSSWTPDAVIVLIGANDAHQNSTGFINDYKSLMELVPTNYADASPKPKLIHVCGGSINGIDACAGIQKANEQFNNGRTDGFQGFYTSISSEHWNAMNGPESRTDGYKGCLGHYNPKGHELLASDIIPQLANIMGWRLTGTEMLV